MLSESRASLAIIPLTFFQDGFSMDSFNLVPQPCTTQLYGDGRIQRCSVI